MAPRTFHGSMKLIADETAGREVLVHGTDTVSAGQLVERAGRIAGWLKAQGIGRSDRIAIWMPNSIDWVAILLAASRLGIAVVSLNTRYKSEELGYILGHSKASILFTTATNGSTDNLAILSDVLRPGAAEAAGGLRKIVLCDDETPAAPGYASLSQVVRDGQGLDPVAAADADPDSILIVLYTSGTTSAPKGVLLSERALMAHAGMLPGWIGLVAGDRKLLVTPFCGVYGLNALIAALLVGAVGIIPEGLDADATLDLMETQRISAISGTVDTLLRRWDAAQRSRPRDLSALSGKVVPVAWLHRDPIEEIPIFEESLGVRLVHAYGMSEVCSMIIVGDPKEPQDVRAYVRGKCIAPEIEARVVSEQDFKDVPAGEIGKLLIRGPSLMSGYLDNEAATRAAFVDGWFDTSDYARKFEDGAIRYEGRAKDIVKIAGFSLNPAELEQFLCRHPKVEQAQVIGFALADGTEVLAAALIAADGESLDPSEITAFCTGKIATYKIPSVVKIVAAYPITTGANGDKIQKNILREDLRQEFLEKNHRE